MARGIVIVLDSGGIGALGDAAAYGDAPGANTIGNTAHSVGGLTLPNFERLGLGCLTAIRGVPPVAEPAAFVEKLDETSKGKDTITGHWEMAGIHTEVPFPTYPDGFPPEVVDGVHRDLRGSAARKRPRFGYGNHRTARAPSTFRPGGRSCTRRPIRCFRSRPTRTSSNCERLYDWCERARAMLVPPNEVNRVIARPFVGLPGHFERTPNRRDFALDPPPNVLDRMARAGVEVHAVGKICDIFNGRGIASSVRVKDNEEAMARTFQILHSIEGGFVFVNLNDFDSKYGHRRDVRGYAAALERLDGASPRWRRRCVRETWRSSPPITDAIRRHLAATIRASTSPTSSRASVAAPAARSKDSTSSGAG